MIIYGYGYGYDCPTQYKIQLHQYKYPYLQAYNPFMNISFNCYSSPAGMIYNHTFDYTIKD